LENRKRGERGPSKLPMELKEVFLRSFHRIQLDPEANLPTWGKNNPDKFYPLIAKLLPQSVGVQVIKDAWAAIDELEGKFIEVHDDKVTDAEYIDSTPVEKV